MDTATPERHVTAKPRQFSLRMILIGTAYIATVLGAVRNLNGETLLVVGIVGAGLAWGNLLILVGAFVGAFLSYATSTGPAIETSHLMITAVGLLLGVIAGWSRHRQEVLEVLTAADNDEAASPATREGVQP